MAKTITPEVGLNILTARSAQYVTIHEVVTTTNKAGETIYRLRVTPVGYSDHPDRSRWTSANTLIDFGQGWEAWMLPW